MIVHRQTKLLLGVGLVVMLALTVAATPPDQYVAHAQQGDEHPGPPDPVPDPGDPEPPYDPQACVDYLDVYTCPGMEEIETNDYTRTIDVVCTGDEGLDGAQLHTCGTAVEDVDPQEDEPDNPPTEPEPDPDPDDPTPPVEVTEITREEPYECDAPQPQVDLPGVDWPEQSIGATPSGTGDHPGVTGLDTWLWADGQDEYLWAETEFGEQGFTVYARDGLFYPDEDYTEWAAEYVYEEARWQCANYGFWYAEIYNWRWILDGPEQIVVDSGTPGSEPNPYGDGADASAHLMPEVMGDYDLILEVTWNGSWGDTWTTTHGPVGYSVSEVRSELHYESP